ncbi:hypothetical protein QNI19_08450 [Cytophagaceae bacterium DM2B3-1]|uniref:Leucine-rich repeat domain-containing protein n=1 Tax=Xanthocytophaga flava TaxID=3048013 RepID=A0ABT7CGU2_9BACT|nr:hypothetical protein [Xanthocytophaga flavus]MDJ1492959.1 hypothetical protein [Xanthocytophaga flavus]
MAFDLLSILKKETMTPKELKEVSSMRIVELSCDLPLTDSFCYTFEKLISLTSLKKLELWNFRVSAETLDLNRRLIQAIGSIKTLTFLKIDINCQLEDQEHLFDPLAELKNLQELILILRGDIPRNEWPKPASRLKRLPDFVNKLSGLCEIVISIQETVPLAEDSFVSLLQLQKFTMYISGPPAAATVQTLMRNLFLLPALKTCHVSGYNNYDKPRRGKPIFFAEDNRQFMSLPQLRIVKFNDLDLGQLPIGLARCENLEELTIGKNYITTFPECLCKIKKLEITHNKTLDLGQILTCLDPGMMETLILNHCKLKELPSQIGLLRKLKKIDIYNNSIKKLPVEIGVLDYLTFLHTTCREIEIHSHAPFSSFLSHLRNHSFTDEEKKAGVAIYFQKNDYLDSVPASTIIPLLLISKPTVPQSVLAVLEKKIPDSIGAIQDSSNLCICLYGVVEGLGLKELKEKYKKYGIRTETTLTNKITHILIGKGITKEQVQLVLKSSLPLVTSGQLRAYLEKLEKPFLKESDQIIVKNLKRLLISVDDDNLQLALEMINQGGLPESVLYTLVLVVLTFIDSKIKKRAMTLLERSAPASVIAAIVRIRLKNDYLKIIHLLWKAPDIDKTLLARAILEISLPEYSAICSRTHEKMVKDASIREFCLCHLMDVSTEDADFALQVQTENNVLDWSCLPLDKLTSSKASLDKVEGLKIHISDFAKKTNPLKSFTGLKILYLAGSNTERRKQAEPNLEKLQQDLPQIQVFFT